MIIEKLNINRVVLLLAALVAMASPSYGEKTDNHNALKDATAAKAIFDINFGEPQKLTLYLNVIDETYTSLQQLGYEPDFIIAFRGQSVRLITTNENSFSIEDKQHLKKGADRLKKLNQKGVQIEACTIATSLFNIDNNSLIPGVRPVGNTFISLIGYQSRDYALIPIQ